MMAEMITNAEASNIIMIIMLGIIGFLLAYNFKEIRSQQKTDRQWIQDHEIRLTVIETTDKNDAKEENKRSHVAEENERVTREILDRLRMITPPIVNYREGGKK